MCADFKSERRGTKNISQCSQSERSCIENLFREHFAGVVYRENIWTGPKVDTLHCNLLGLLNYILHLINTRDKCRLHWHQKPESFSHSGFLLIVARQLPLNTPKNPNRKTHLRSVIFWNSAEISLVFCQCKRSLQSRRYYLGFWSRGTWPSAESPDRGPRRNAHYTCMVKGREKSPAHHLPKHKYEIQVFSRMRFSCQNPRMLWVFLAVY